MNTKEKGGTGIAMATIVVAFLILIVMVSGMNVETEIVGQRGLFMIFSYITLGLSLLVFFFALLYMLKKRKAGVVIGKRREEEIIKTIREIKELKRRIEERGENLTSLSDVFFTQVSILSEISSMRTLLEVLVAFCLAIISMLFVIMSML